MSSRAISIEEKEEPTTSAIPNFDPAPKTLSNTVPASTRLQGSPSNENIAGACGKSGTPSIENVSSNATSGHESTIACGNAVNSNFFAKNVVRSTDTSIIRDSTSAILKSNPSGHEIAITHSSNNSDGERNQIADDVQITLSRKASTDQNIPRDLVTKFPVFQDGQAKEDENLRSSRRPRRRRASTPHPNATVSRSIESTSTSPQTTPERKSRRNRRHLKKSKWEKECNLSTPSSNGTDLSPSELESGPDPKVAKKAESPLTPTSNGRPQAPKGELSAHSDAIDSSTSLVERVSEPEVGDRMSASENPPKEKSTEGEIDHYASFQTIAILEFEPDFSLASVTQATEVTLEAAGSRSKTNEEVKVEANTSEKWDTSRRFRRAPPVFVPPPPKPFAKEGFRPSIVTLFERYGVEFLKTKRPYLQYFSLEAGAKQKFPDVNTRRIRREFCTALKRDSKFEWPDNDYMNSPIDLYFAEHDCRVRTKAGHENLFVYDPRNEITVEFQRLARVEKWIKEDFAWDAKSWEESMRRFEGVWSNKKARKERARFRRACFLEYRLVVGHTDPGFHSGDGKNDQASQSDWGLKEYNQFLECFGRPPHSTIEECQAVIESLLEVNIFDLLHWFRNPESRFVPETFKSTKELRDYSYSNNKVFPKYRPNVSDIGLPSLRSTHLDVGEQKPTSKWKRGVKRGSSKPNAAKAKLPTDISGTREPNDKENVAIFREKATAAAKQNEREPSLTTVSTINPKSSPTTVSSTSIPADSSNAMEPIKGEGASLFSLPQTAERIHTEPVKRRRPFTRKRRSAISGKRPSSEIVVDAAEIVAVAA